MIPYKAALAGWIIVSILLMADRNNARGFSLAFIGSLMLMPAKYGLDLPGLPSLEKIHVACLGVIIGTILFHPKVIENMKLVPSDLLLVGSMQMMFASAVVNDQGYFSGASRALQFGLEFALPVFLARLHIGTPRGMRTFLLTMVLAAVAYAPLAVWEFRMSPQIHTEVYGYFQHTFAQFRRGSFWRPVLFFPHALDLGRFFAFTAFLAMLPMRRDLLDLFGRRGKFLFLLPLLGLFVSQSWGPYMMFFLLCGGYFMIQRNTLIAYIIPIIAFTWLAMLFAGLQPGFSFVADISNVNQDRAESLAYRLRALEYYRPVLLEQPFLGYGGFGNGRLDGVATDSQALMNIVQSGFLGAAIFYAWWVVGMHAAFSVMRKVPNTILAKRAAAAGMMASLALSINVIDQALNSFLLLILGGFIGIHVWLNTNQNEGSTQSLLQSMAAQTNDPPNDREHPPHQTEQPG
ncbi:MAG: hypothetical protein COA73_11695 [Candidatus Hydrogenedentota bacterium]|nr:MAG: hypothetical protein COA73_11695 [Candidatus Hydrogenedentota bacterium]